MKLLRQLACAFAALLLWSSSSMAAPALSELDWQQLKVWARAYGASEFPLSPRIGWLVIITDDSAANACDSAGGSFISLCAWNGATWVAVGGGDTPSLDQAFDAGKVIDGANSLGNAMCVGDNTNKLCFYVDGTLGPLIRPQPDANTRFYIWTDKTGCIFDVEGNSCTLVIDPDAVDNEKYTWTTGYRPIKTLALPADALFILGASTLVTDTALISGGLISPYLTTTDSDSDGAYRYLVMDPKWDGGTVTATITVVNVNATPANALVMGISGECYPAGTVIPTTISATGAQNATVSFGAGGSCGGSACSQNDPASATTVAITINGTPAGGNFCGFQARTSASGTTETVAGIKIVQLDIHYKIAKGF